MKTIWKYELEGADTQTLLIPKGYEILSIQRQWESTCLWVMVDTSNEKEAVIIDIFGTGNPVNGIERKYIGTYQLNGGGYVFHAFERY